MFSRLCILSSLALLAVATPWGVPTVTVTETAPAPTVTAVSQCDTGSINCCNQLISAQDASAGLLGILNSVLQGLEDVTGLIGSGCSPISEQGIGNGNACDASPVCCSNNNVAGLFSIGCQPLLL